MDVRAKLGDSMLNSDRTVRLFVPPGPFLHIFVQYLIAFCSRLEAANDAIFGTLGGAHVPDKPVKCRDPGLSRSEEIPPEDVVGGLFDVFLRLLPTGSS